VSNYLKLSKMTIYFFIALLIITSSTLCISFYLIKLVRKEPEILNKDPEIVNETFPDLSVYETRFDLDITYDEVQIKDGVAKIKAKLTFMSRMKEPVLNVAFVGWEDQENYEHWWTTPKLDHSSTVGDFQPSDEIVMHLECEVPAYYYNHQYDYSAFLALEFYYEQSHGRYVSHLLTLLKTPRIDFLNLGEVIVRESSISETYILSPGY